MSVEAVAAILRLGVAGPSNSQAFGKRIAEIRRENGLKQKEVVGRIRSYYSDERSYRRIESGERVAGRDAAIAILTVGLQVSEPGIVNDALSLAGYAALTGAEVRKLKLTSAEEIETAEVVPGPSSDFRGSVKGLKFGFRTLGLLVVSVIVSVVVAAISQNAGFVLTTAVLYAALYAISVWMESAFDPRRPTVAAVGIPLFCFMLVSSVVALAIDSKLAGIGDPIALELSLAIFLIAAGVQWILARAVLSESAIVPMEFQSLTAQTAHLKNTGYFLVIVVLFWLPPFHCIAGLQREIRVGHAPAIRNLISHPLFVGNGFAALSPPWLWGAFLILGLLAIPMAARLIENLKSHPALNTYTALLYLRAIVYFVLVFICLIRYSSEIGALPIGEAASTSP